MVYYNNFFYKFKKAFFYFLRFLVTKKMLINIILLLVAIILILLFPNNKSNAASFELSEAIENGDLRVWLTQNDKLMEAPQNVDLGQYVENPEEYIYVAAAPANSYLTYKLLVFSTKPIQATGTGYGINNFAYPSGNKFVFFQYSSQPSHYTFVGTTPPNTGGYFWWSQGYANYDLYNPSGELLLPKKNQNITFPYILNTTEDLATNNYGSLLITPGVFSNTQAINFVLYTVTEETTENGLSYENETAVYNTVLNSSSSFIQNSEELGYYYEIPISTFSLQANTKYNYYLSFQLFDNIYYINKYSFATSSGGGEGGGDSGGGIPSGTVTDINDISNSTSEINDFLQDDTFDSSSITENMPEINVNDVTASGIENIFNNLRLAFTDNSSVDFVFTIPFTNGQTITIPANLTENICPEVIKNLIRMVYWFLISRFIIKDIAKYIEKIKSGEIVSSTDTNIKTEML